MPIRMPVVNGTPSLPASSMVFSRSDGTLVGSQAFRVRCARAARLVLSSIRPRLGLVARRRSIQLALSSPGLACGSSFVSRSTSSHMASR